MIDTNKCNYLFHNLHLLYSNLKKNIEKRLNNKK